MNGEDRGTTQRVASVPTSTELHFIFTGSGRDYFRVWIVNLALTLLTLGIYSAWARVRRAQYFRRHTIVAGFGLDFVAHPFAVLRGRIVVILLIALYYLFAEVSSTWITIAAVIFVAVAPAIVWQALCFRLDNTTYRGLRFGFDGSLAQSYRTFIIWASWVVPTLGIAFPIAQWHFNKYQFDNAHYGDQRFALSATRKDFVTLWARTFALWLCCALITLALLYALNFVFTSVPYFSLTAWSLPPIIPAAMIIAYWLTRAYYTTQRQNMLWNSLSLGRHRFSSRAHAWSYFAIVLRNAVLTVLTLGLFAPFAAVARARYLVSALAIIPGDSLDNAAAGAQYPSGAFGSETLALLDWDMDV